MKQVETGCSTIFRFDNALPDSICDRIVNYLKKVKTENNSLDINLLPWHNEDTLQWTTIEDDLLRSLVDTYRDVVTRTVGKCYNETVYPHFTDLVIWRAGRSMPRHIDNGYTDEEVYLRQRSYTTLTYLNDDYTGGETFITSENGDYISSPKKGTLIILKSTADNAHGVNKVESGIRYTFPIWFTKNFEHRER